MRIEPPEIDDLDRIADLWVALAEDQCRHGSHLAGEANRERVRVAMARHRVDGTLLVARERDEVVGFVSFEVETGGYESTATRGRIENVYVVPEARNEGVGSALLDAAESTLADRDADTVALEAMADNDDARRLYRRRGYRLHRVEYEKPVESDTHSRE